jgi:hypothetical protein
VRPHRHRELLKLPEELEVGWLRGGHFWGFAACKNAAAFDALCEDLRKHHGEIDISDMRSNAKVTGSPALLAACQQERDEYRAALDNIRINNARATNGTEEYAVLKICVDALAKYPREDEIDRARRLV